MSDYDPAEEDFLNIVRRFQEIGYGRMMQIISYESHETHKLAASIPGTKYGLLTPKKQKQFREAKASDPLARHWPSTAQREEEY